MTKTVNEPIGPSTGGTDAARSQGPHIIDGKYEAYRKYTLIADDEQQFHRTARELVQGAKLLTNLDLLAANLAAVMKRVRVWCDGNRSSLKAAFILLRPGKMALFFVPVSERYDVTLDAKMTELEVQLGGSAGVGSIESFQIPDRSIENFVSDDALLLWTAT